MTHPYWPIFDLRIAFGDVRLRPTTESDLEPLAASLPDDLEMDPDATRYPGLTDHVHRRVVMHQAYWSAWGSWSPAAWRLPFVVERADLIIGNQSLEGTDFTRLRTVDSSSYLILEARRKGIGTAMRRAMLALAFGPLEAEAAVSSAWQGNHASLSVSRALGYEPNGESRHARNESVDRMLHVRLTRETWLQRNLSTGITIEGFDACRPLFGLDRVD